MPDSNPFEARMLATLDRASSAPAARRTPMPSSPRAVHSGDLALAAVRKPVETPEVNRSSDGRDLTKAKAPIIQAKAIKCVINLDPAQLLGLRVRDGDERTMLIVEVGGRRVAVGPREQIRTQGDEDDPGEWRRWHVLRAAGPVACRRRAGRRRAVRAAEGAEAAGRITR